MSAPVMRRSFNLHFNGGNTHVEADCTASRTLAELLADSLFSAFPQFASLRLYSAGSNSRSKELEKEMEKYYVCKAPASTLTSPLVLPGSRTGAPSSAPTSSSTTTRGRKRGSGGGEDMVEIPLSTATQIAPCDLFVISLPADGGSLVAGKASVANSGSSTRRGRRKASPPRPGRRRAAAIEAAPPPRTKRKYTRRATAPVEGSREDTIEGEEDERGGSGSGSDENDEDEDGASGSEGTDSGSDSGGSGSDGTSSDSGGSRSVLSTSSSNSVSDDDEVGDGNDDDSASGSARSSGDDADGSSRSGSDSDDDDAGSSDSDSNSTRRRKRRPRRTRTPGRPRGRTASRRTTTKASAPTSATAPAVGRPKRKYTRRVKKDAAEEEESGSASKAAPAKRTRRRTRTKSAPRRTSSRRSATATAEAAAAAAAGGAAGGKTSTPTTTATTTVAGGGASRSASGSPVLVTPDGQPIKRKRGRPPKNAPRYVEAVPAATQASSPTTTTTHTRANSTVSNDPIPLPPRRKRNRTRSPGPSAAGGMGADGTVMGGDSLWKSKGGLVGGTRQPQPSPEELGIAAGSSAPTSASSLSVPMAGASSLSGIVAYEGGPPDSLGGVPVPAGDSGAVSLSRKDAQLRAIEQQRQRIFAAGDFVGGGKSFAPGGAGGGEGYTEEELRQAALLQEHQQQLRLLQQRRLLVRLNDYSASPPPSPPSHAATTTMSGPSSEANRTALASAMTNGFVENGGNSPAVDGTTEEKAKAEEESSTIRAPAASDVDTLAQLFGDVDGDGGGAMARQGTFSIHRFQQPQVPRSAGPTVPSHFRLPLLLQRAAQVANPSAVAAATTAASEGHTSTFLLSHPLACQAVPEVSVYGGLASACEEAMLPDPSPRAAPLSASTTRSAAAERSGNGRDKTKERGIPGRSSTAAASTEQRASSVKREKLTEEDASDEADGGKQSGAAGGPAFAYPTVSPFALLDEDELHALATRRMFTAPPSTASAASGDGGGNKSAVESDEAGELGEVAYCDPAQVSISLPIVVGGCVRLVNPESREKSHQWTVYVRGLFNGYPPRTSSGSSRDAMAGATGRPSHPACFPEKEEAVQEEETDYLSHFVDHVTFILDRSFTPCVRTVYKAPFEVTEVGWGEFVVSIHVHLRFPGYSPFTRAMKRTLKCYLSGSGGRAALIASTGPGRGASGLDPVTSMNLTPASNRGGGGGGGAATMASNTDTNLLVDSFLDVNFNSAARSLYYRGPFLSPHLHHDTDVYLPMRNEEEAAAARHYLTDAIPSRRHRGVAGGHHKNEEEAREGDKDDDCADAEEAEHELYHLLADYLRDREEENADMQDNPSSYGSEEYAYNGAIHATTAGGGGGGGGGSGSGDGVKRELSQTGSGVNNSEDSLPTSAPASPTSSLTVVDGADFGAVHSRSESGSGSAVPAVRQPKKRGPKPSRRGVTARGASSQSQAVGGAASASTTLRAGHKGNVAVLSHLLRFSHRQRSTPLIPPQGDVRAPKKFEHLGYTLVPEPVVTENYDELVIPLHGLTHSVKCARHYTGLSRLLAKEEARHAELVSQFEAALHGGGGGGSGFAKDPVVKGDGAETRDKGDRMDVVAPRTEAEHLQHIRQCEDRIAVLQKLMVELTRVVRADRRLLRSAALLEGRLRDALQVYLLSHRPPATPSAAATDAASSGVEGLPFAPYMAQLLPQLPRQPPGDPSSNDGDSSSNNNNTKRRDRETFTGGVSSWPHICSHGNAAEKDVLLAFSYLSSVAESALAEGWLGFALLQARRRVFPATTGAAAAVGAAGLDTFATSEASRTTSTSPSAAAAGKSSANSTTFARVKREVEDEEEQKGKGDFTRGLWVRLFTSFYARLPSSVFPLTSVEFDLAAATLLASLLPIQQQQQQRSQTLGEGSAMADSDMSAMHVPSSPVDSMSTTCALLFADVLLPRAMELGTAVLHTRQLSGGSGDKGKHKEGMEGVHVALSSAFFLRQSETPSQSGGERKEEEEECEGREDLARRVLSGHLQFPLYTDPIPGSQTDEQRTSWGCGHNQSSSSGSVVFDPLTASMIWQASSGSSSTGHGHGNHGQSRPQSAAAAAAATAAAALLRSRGLLPPPLSPSSSSLISSAPPPPSGPSSSSPLPFPPSASTTGAGAASATPTFASGESKLQYGDVADVAQLRAMKTALLEAIHAMRVEAAKRQAVLSLRQM